MEEPARSDAASSEAVPSNDVAPQTEPELEEDVVVSECEEEEEYIGVDPEEVRESSDFQGCTEAEIKEEEVEFKEEEIEFNTDELPEGAEEDDPIGDVNATDDTSTDTADEGESEPANRKQRKVTGNVLIKIRKTERQILPEEEEVPQFVPGLTVKRDSNLLCLECGRCFSSQVCFASHRKKYHVQLPDYLHPCPYCKRKFNSREDLLGHLLHHTRLEKIRCPVCHLAMNSATTLADHMADHRKPCAKYRCNLCAKQFASAEKLNAHNVDKHTKLPKISKVVSPTDLVCFVCGKSELTYANLYNHMSQHIGAVKCKFCSSSQNNVEKLAIHVSKFHNNQRTISYDFCPNCNEIFFSQLQMIQHKPLCVLPNSLNSWFRLECDICNMSYFDVEHFESHMRLHAALSQESIPKPCQLCSFFAKNTSEHALHMTGVHGFRDTVESMENELDKMAGIKCVVPKCRRTPKPPGQIFHHLPDSRAQPRYWKRLLQTFRLPWDFKPEPTQRICGVHFTVYNAAISAGGQRKA